jgi:hypothetical protein
MHRPRLAPVRHFFRPACKGCRKIYRRRHGTSAKSAARIRHASGHLDCPSRCAAFLLDDIGEATHVPPTPFQGPPARADGHSGAVFLVGLRFISLGSTQTDQRHHHRRVACGCPRGGIALVPKQTRRAQPAHRTARLGQRPPNPRVRCRKQASQRAAVRATSPTHRLFAERAHHLPLFLAPSQHRLFFLRSTTHCSPRSPK